MAEVKVATVNRKAFHDYFIEEKFEAGIVLTGTEVKSLRSGRANLRDAYAMVEEGELFLFNMHISHYEFGNRYNHDPTRKRKLLMHRAEISRLLGQVKKKGYSLVPLRVYFNPKGIAKVELALARGKKQYDKREAMAERDARRRMDRALKERSAGI